MGYDMEALTQRLTALSDAGYAAFHRGLIPDSSCQVVGVRMPALRAVAKDIRTAPDWRDFLESSRSHPIYEMRMLHAMVLGSAQCPVDEKLRLMDALLPHIDNWAVCDGLVTSFKPRASEREAVYEYAKACAASDAAFKKRFGLVMLMSRFRDAPFLPGVMAVYRSFRHEAYYARMAAAWGLVTLWPDAREDCLSILEENLWDPFTHNKAIQKLLESDRISEQDKALARSLRRAKESVK